MEGYTREFKGIPFKRVFKGNQGYSRVYKGIQWYSRVNKCIQGYNKGYTRVYKVNKGIQGYPRVINKEFKGIYWYTGVFKSTTVVFKGMQVKGIQGKRGIQGKQGYTGVFKGIKGYSRVNVETSIRCDHSQNPAVYKVTKINCNEKTAKKKRRATWFSRYFGQSSRPSSGDLRTA